MVNRSALYCLLGLGICLLPSAVPGKDRTPLTAPVPDFGPSAAELSEWILDLSSHNFGTRMEASRKLSQAGLPAVKAVAQAAETNDLELATRCISILEQWTTSQDELVQKAAEEALQNLTKSDFPSVAQRAELALEKPEDLIVQNQPFRAQVQVIGNGNLRVVNLGARKAIQREAKVEENGKKIHIQQEGQKIKIKVTETKEGAEKSTDYEANSPAELKKKHPDIYEIYVKHIKGANVKIKVQPAIQPVPARQVLPIQIQIQGQIQRQVLPAQPMKVQKQQIRMRTVKGIRNVDVIENDREIHITDAMNEDIVIKVTETVNGKKQTTEYKAKNLDELKKKHPEGAKIFEQYAGEQKEVIFGGFGGAGPVPFPVPANGPLPNQAQPLPAVAPRIIPAQKRNVEAQKQLEEARQDLTRATEDLREYVKQGNPQPEVIQDLIEQIQTAQKKMSESLRKTVEVPAIE